MVIAQANGEVNWAGIVVLGLLALLALGFVASNSGQLMKKKARRA